MLISLYSARSEQAFCEELEYHLLFRWFLGMDIVVRRADHRRLLSDEHFTVGRHTDRSGGKPEELPAQGSAAVE